MTTSRRAVHLLLLGLVACTPARPADRADASPPDALAGLTFGATKADEMKDRGCKETTTPEILECPLDRSVAAFDAPVWAELCEGRICTVSMRRLRPDKTRDDVWMRSFLDLESTLEGRYGPPDPRPAYDGNYCTDLPTLRAGVPRQRGRVRHIQWNRAGPEGLRVKLQLQRGPGIYQGYSLTYENAAGVFLQMQKIAE